MEDYIRESVMENISNPLQKQDDDEDNEEDKQYESNDPIDWVEDNINEVWMEDEEVIVQIQSVGGENEEQPLSQAKETLYDVFPDDKVEDICEEIEDMAD